MAADAIAEMADVLAARASAWADDWYRRPGDGPVLGDDLFSEFVRQSFALDLSDFVAVPERYVRSVCEKSHEDTESVVAEVTKETALLLAGAEDVVEIDVEQEIRHQGYDEDIAAWAEAVRGWMMSSDVVSANIMEIVEVTNLSTVKV